MSSKFGFSKPCGQCFGGLSSCVVSHCLTKCAFSPNSSGCKTCTNQHCTPAFETCTGFTPPSSLESTLATSCTAADEAIWTKSVKADFNADEKECAERCGGQNPCTGDCMSSKHGFTKACGQCFGGLSSCVVRHCVVAPGNCGINPNGESCKKCTDQFCTPAFESCTGFTVPASLESTLATSCTAADESIWTKSVKANFSADEKE